MWFVDGRGRTDLMDWNMILPGRALDGVLSELDRRSHRVQTRSRWRNQVVRFQRGAPGDTPASETAALDAGFWNAMIRVRVSASTGVSPGFPVVRLSPTLALIHGATTVASSVAVIDTVSPLDPLDSFVQSAWIGVSGVLPVPGELRLTPNNTTSGGTVAVEWSVTGVAFGS